MDAWRRAAFPALLRIERTARAMPTPSEPTPPAAPALNTHRLHLHENHQTVRVNVHPPLEVSTLAELAHLLDTWHAPETLKVFVLDLTACAPAASVTSADGLAPKGLLEGR